MFDVSQPVLQRMRGEAHVAVSMRDGQVRLDALRQAGSGKAFLPKVHGPVPEIVFLNTAGGLTGGDRLRYGVEVGAGARALATTQTAERAYRASYGVAELDVRLSVGAGGVLDWLPQETILFDGAALSRRTDVDLAEGARFLMAEMVTLGRAAMGEEVRRLEFTDRRRVRRDGVPVFVEPIWIGTGMLADRRPAGLADATALATVALIAPGAEDALGGVQALPETRGVRAFASGWDGKLVLRAMARDAWPLRRHVARVIEHLRGAPLPRVWHV